MAENILCRKTHGNGSKIVMYGRIHDFDLFHNYKRKDKKK